MTFHGFSCLNLLAEHAFDFYEGKCKVAFYLLSSTLDSPFAEGTIGCVLGDNSYFVVTKNANNWLAWYNINLPRDKCFAWTLILAIS